MLPLAMQFVMIHELQFQGCWTIFLDQSVDGSSDAIVALQCAGIHCDPGTKAFPLGTLHILPHSCTWATDIVDVLFLQVSSIDTRFFI